MAIQPWKRTDPTEITKLSWRTMVNKSFVRSDGKVLHFDTMNQEGWAAAGVIALTPDNEVVICRQFRVGPEKLMNELPAGIVDDGETPEHAAVRELREETGYEAGTLEYLGKTYKDAYINGTWHYFLARDCVRRGAQELDGSEEIEVGLASIKEIITYAQSGQMTDAVAVLMAYEKLQEIIRG